MAIDNFEYTHPNGWEDSVNFPTTPANETQTRQLLQQQHKEVRDYLKTKLVPGVNEHLAENVHQQEVHGLKIEKGTWTPVLVGSTVAGEHAYSNQIGRYTKIDNLVYISMRLTVSSVDSSASGDLNIAGLPFISISQDVGLSISSLTNIKIEEGSKFVFARTLAGKIELVRVHANTFLPARVPISVVEANPNAEIRLSGVYETN